MKTLRKILFGIVLLVTVTLVPGLECDFSDSDCDVFCDED